MELGLDSNFSNLRFFEFNYVESAKSSGMRGGE